MLSKPVRRITLALFAIVALSSAPLAALAEDNSGLFRGMLDELLGQKDQPPAKPDQGSQPKPADDSRRIPFGREEMQLSFAPLVKATAPAVVNVYASSKVDVRSPFMDDPFFERFFGQQMPPRVQSSLGSGVLVDPSGIIVTNNHVVQGADEVKVALSDGREFESKILLKDQNVDLAVLKIEAKEPFPTIALADSDALEVGDLVLAIGNPFGVGQTVTSGIVSALARSHIGISDYGFFIQTDAAINPGNSGGALINMKGELVGINSAIYSQSGGSIGIGFAIPSNMVRAFLASAKSGSGYFERPYIGAEFQDVNAQEAEALGMERATGALVASVTKDGPAAKAGLRAGDVVLAVNGTPVDGPEALNYRISTQPIGGTASLDILDQGAKRTVRVSLERAPEGNSAAQLTIGGDGPFSGTTVAALSPRLAQKLNLPGDKTGVCVVEVASGSPAENVGFQPGDIVRDVNGATISSAEDLKKAAEKNTRWWKFTIERGGQLIRQVIRF